jgi:hypothetical protein
MTSMSSSPAMQISTETLAPDTEQGPFRITLSWHLLAGRWEAVGIAIEFADARQVRPLQTSDLRRLRLPLIVEQAAVELRRRLGEKDAEFKTAPSEPLTSRAYRERLVEARRAEEAFAAAAPRRPGRPSRPLRELERVAEIYADAFYRHEPPTKAVADGLGITYSAAAKRIARCRALGLLGPGERGKASVGALIGRGDADTLASLNVIADEVAERQREKDRLEAGLSRRSAAPERSRDAREA